MLHNKMLTKMESSDCVEFEEVHPFSEMEFSYEEITEYLTMKEKILH